MYPRTTIAFLLTTVIAGCTRHVAVNPATSPVLKNLAFEARTELDVGAARVADGVLADFDGDGRLDLAVTTLSDKLQILLGQGSGVFALAQSLSAPGFSFNVRAGDLDGDQDIDLVALRSVDERVSVFKNDGNGTFSLFGDLVVPRNGDSMTLGDCDRDGNVDIAISHLSSPDVTVLLGAGDGTFAPATGFSLPAGASAAGLVVADSDGDGDQELVVSDTEGDRVFIVSPLAGGGYTIEQEIPVGQFPHAVSIGDLNVDGVPDLVVSAIEDETVSVLLGQGGTFVPWRTYGLAAAPSLNLIADVTGDGLNDLIVCTFDRARVSVFAGRSTGDLAPPAVMPASGLPYRPLVGDVNGDNRPDLLATGTGTSMVNLYLGGPEGLRGSTTHDPGVARPEVVAAEDMDGDGRAEIVVADRDGTEIVIMSLPRGATSFRALETLATLDFGLPLVGVVAGDYDGDGDMDFAINTRLGVKLLVNVSVGRNLQFTAMPSAPSAVILPASGPFDVAGADLNGDGLVDLVATDAVAETVTVLTAEGVRLQYGAVPTVTPVSGVPGGLVVGDFDFDGHLDVAVSRNLAASVVILHNDGAGRLEPGPVFPVGAQPNYMRGTDFDGDGRIDLAVSNAATDEVTVLIARGNGFTSRVLSVGSVPTGLVATDLNRDGHADVLVVSHASSDIQVVLGTGDGGFGPQFRFPGTYRATSAAMADVDGDGFPDLIVGSDDTQRVNIYRNISSR